MIDELAATAKQTALELIDMSDKVANNMETWADVLAQNPESETAKLSAGFINKNSAASDLEMAIDVQTPPDEPAVLRAWAIHTKTGDDQKEYFNNIQLTFEADRQKVDDLITKGGSITREDISTLLQDQATHLIAITVSDETAGDGMQQTHGKRYDFAVDELNDKPDEATELIHALQKVLQKLKQAA